MPVEPVTLAEWQQAADAASLALLIDTARRFGLVSGGPDLPHEQRARRESAEWAAEGKHAMSNEPRQPQRPQLP